MRNGTMQSRLILAFAVAAALSPWMGSERASAQEVQITGPLAGAPACRTCRIYREGRFQIQPFVGFTLQDEFSRTMLFGAQLQYHFTDWLGLGLWGGFGGVHLDTGLTDEVAAGGQTTDRNALSLPSRKGFPDQIGTINWAAAAQLEFIPLRGKLSLFQKLFVDSDFYFFGGVAAVGVEERANINFADAQAKCGEGAFAMAGGSPAPCIATQDDRASRVAIAPTFGAGIVLYFNEFMGLSLEWRALPFAWNTSGTDEGGTGPDDEFPDGQINGDDRIFKFNHMVNVGLVIYLPTSADVSE